MTNTIAFIIASLLVGCAATSGTEYTRVYDHKYNEARLVQKEGPGTFVGTGAIKQPARPSGQHP